MIFYFAGIFIAFFSSFLILGKKRKNISDYVLSVWFFVIGLHLTLFIYIFSGEYLHFPGFLGIEKAFPFIHGPILYLYIESLTRQKLNKYWFLHFLTVVSIYCILYDFFILPPEEKIEIYQNEKSYLELRKALNILMIISGIIYISLSFVSLKKYKSKISNQYSNLEKINLNWAYYLIIGMLIIWFCVITKNDILIFTSVVIFVLTAAYFGINKAGILNISELEINTLEEIQPEKKEVPVKYQKSLLSDEKIQLIYKKLVHKMESEKLYTDPELNLNLVSNLLEVHPNLLSQIINTVENKNFYDYVNTYRIREFKRLAVLPENEKFTILSLAFESGFNSKTSFNRNFKKYENKSPKEFLKEQNLDLK